MVENNTTTLESRLDTAPLLPGADPEEFDVVPVDAAPDSPMGIFSAARFFQRRPEVYRAIARAQLEGLSDAACARVWGIHHRTAAAIRAREEASTAAESYREKQARRLRSVGIAAAEAVADRLARDPGGIAVKDLAQVIRVAHDAERALEGAPSSIVGVLRPDGASARLAKVLGDGDIVEAEILEPEAPAALLEASVAAEEGAGE